MSAEAGAGREAVTEDSGPHGITSALVDLGADAIEQAERDLGDRPIRQYPNSWRRTLALAVLQAAAPRLAAAERELIAERAGNWTVSASGWSNSSPEFQNLVADVARIISSETHTPADGIAVATAQLIMAQLAHEHGLAPVAALLRDAGERGAR